MQRARELFYVDNTIMSVDDWKMKFGGRDLSVKMKLPASTGGVGWVAENVVTVPHHFLLGTRKRHKHTKTESSTAGFTAVIKPWDTLQHLGASFTADRGYTSCDLAELNTVHCCCC